MADVKNLVSLMRLAKAETEFQNEESYWGYVRGVALEVDDVDPAEVLATLAGMGRDVEQFQQHLILMNERYALVRGVNELPEWEAKKAAVDAELEAKIAAFNVLSRAHNEACKELWARQASVGAAVESRRAGRTRLAHLCPYQHLLGREEQLNHAVHAIRTREQDVARAIKDCETTLAAPPSRDFPGKSADLKRDAEYRLPALLRERTDLNEELVAARAELEVVERKKLQP